MRPKIHLIARLAFICRVFAISPEWLITDALEQFQK
jgi:hypothetical protein